MICPECKANGVKSQVYYEADYSQVANYSTQSGGYMNGGSGSPIPTDYVCSYGHEFSTKDETE